MTDLVRFEVVDGVGIITLDRPDRLNALSDAMHRALDDAFVRAFRADEARVILLTGAGRAFCAGADMDRLDRLAEGKGRNFDLPRPGIVAQQFAGLDAPPELLGTYTFPLAIPKPVIAAVNGPCIGVGMVLAACCDIRFAGERAMFSAAFGQRGVVAEFGLAWLMPRLVGLNMANDILLSGRRVLAKEAQAIGLVSRVEPDETLMEAALDYAREMARTISPRSARLIKRQVWTSFAQSFGEAAGESHDLLLEALASEDFAEGVASYREKRPPRFTGR